MIYFAFQGSHCKFDALNRIDFIRLLSINGLFNRNNLRFDKEVFLQIEQLLNRLSAITVQKGKFLSVVYCKSTENIAIARKREERRE